MNSRKSTARWIGVLYLVMGACAVIDLTYFPTRFLVPRDPSATAARIESAKSLYRLCVLTDLTSGALNVLLAVTLYQFFKDVDRRWARLLIAVLLVQVPMYFAIMLIQIAPLVVLSGTTYSSAFNKTQLDALAYGLLNWRENAVVALSIYWGLWLLPIAVLAYRSKFLPRLLGVVVGIAAVAYVMTALVWFIAPAMHAKAFWLASPIYGLGEISFILYLLIKGVRTDAEPHSA